MAYLPSFLLTICLLSSFAVAEPAERHALLVVNKLGDTLSIIDPETGEERSRVAVGEGPHEVAASSNGRLAVVTNYGRNQPGNSLTVIDVPRGEAIKTIGLEQYHRPHGIAFMPDDKRVVVTAEAERKLLVVNAETGDIEAAIDTDQEISHMVALSGDGGRAYVPNIRSGSVSVIDLESEQLVTIVETGAGAEGVAVHGERNEVWVSNRAANNVTVIDMDTNEVVATIESARFPIRVGISPDGRHALVSNARSNEVAVFEIESRAKIADIEMEAEPILDERRMFSRTFGDSTVPIGLLFSPDGRHAYVAVTRADVIAVIDTETWAITDHFETDKEPDGLAWATFSADEAAAQQIDATEPGS